MLLVLAELLTQDSGDGLTLSAYLLGKVSIHHQSEFIFELS